MIATRSKQGNVLLPIHENLDGFMTKIVHRDAPPGMDLGKQIDSTKMLLHVSNQIYELHQSLYGWEEAKAEEVSKESQDTFEEVAQSANWRRHGQRVEDKKEDDLR